jgi:hypothetical protein
MRSFYTELYSIIVFCVMFFAPFAGTSDASLGDRYERKIDGTEQVTPRANNPIVKASVNTAGIPNVWDGSVDTSWYAPNKKEYTIATGAQLAGLAKIVNSKTDNFYKKPIRLISNIDLAGKDWTPIGNQEGADSNLRGGFFGDFDGGNYTISNLTIKGNKDDIGLFGIIGGVYQSMADGGASIKNVILKNVNIAGGKNVGGLIGFFSNGGVNDCKVSGSVKGTENVGGVLGFVMRSRIDDCNSNVKVGGNTNVGGISGAITGGGASTLIRNCKTDSTVNGNERVGGLIGYGYGIVEACSASGSVGGASSVGGLVGQNGDVELFNNMKVDIFDGKNPSAVNCGASNKVTGKNDVGGLIGYNVGSITESKFNGTVSGNGNVGLLIGYHLQEERVASVSISGNTVKKSGDLKEIGHDEKQPPSSTNTVENNGNTPTKYKLSDLKLIVVTGDGHLYLSPNNRGERVEQIYYAHEGESFIVEATPVKDTTDNSEWYKTILSFSEYDGTIIQHFPAYINTKNTQEKIMDDSTKKDVQWVLNGRPPHYKIGDEIYKSMQGWTAVSLKMQLTVFSEPKMVAKKISLPKNTKVLVADSNRGGVVWHRDMDNVEWEPIVGVNRKIIGWVYVKNDEHFGFRILIDANDNQIHLYDY